MCERISPGYRVVRLGKPKMTRTRLRDLGVSMIERVNGERTSGIAGLKIWTF